MRSDIAVATALLVSSFVIQAAAQAIGETQSTYEQSVVGLNVTFQQWDEDRPWAKKKPETRRASGILIDDTHILTTAQMLNHATFLQLETFGRARPVQPKIERIDRTINLALLSIDGSSAGELRPVALAERTPTFGTLRTARWRGQQLEAAASRVIRFEVEQASGSHAYHALLRMRTDMSAGGWADPVFSGDRLVGITVSQSEDESRAIPVEILRAFLERGSVPDIGESFTTLGANWQVNRDTAVSRFLGQQGEPRGILIRQVPWGSTGCGVLKSRDILLELGGELIDPEGYYNHAWLGRLGFNHILAEQFRPGDAVPARVLRDGKELDLTMTARAYPSALNLLPTFQYSPPPYIIVGGLVIRELDVPYLRTWGKDWSKDAPDSLLSRYFYRAGAQTAERRRTVFISSVMPSGYTTGYHELRDVVIERVNGRVIGRIEDVSDALPHAQNGFHVIDLAPESSRDQIILDAAGLQAATGEILKIYSVPAAFRPREEPLPEGGGECPDER